MIMDNISRNPCRCYRVLRSPEMCQDIRHLRASPLVGLALPPSPLPLPREADGTNTGRPLERLLCYANFPDMTILA